MSDDDATKLADLARGLPKPDLESTTAERIAHVARQNVGIGPPKRRLLLPIAVGLLVSITLGWALFHVWQSLQ